ncbi:MAG: hypothetical protein AB1486_00865 [Planctomycetota bacterium]
MAENRVIERIGLLTTTTGSFRDRDSKRTRKTEISLSECGTTRLEVPAVVLAAVARAAAEATEAISRLESLLAADTVEAPEVVPVLQACTRVFRLPDVDPTLEEKTIALALEAANIALAGNKTGTAPVAGLSHQARLFRAAVAFLCDVAAERSFDFLLGCVENQRAVSLLGMDEIQQLRNSLQRLRSTTTPERRRRLDNCFRRVLTETAERLFSLEEVPLNAHEQSEFWQARDLRYNSIAYYCDQWRRNPDIRQAWAEDPNAADLLGAFVLASEEEAVGEPHDRLYSKVREKVETRVLAAQLLVWMKNDLGADVPLNLFNELVRLLAAEVGALQETEALLVSPGPTDGESSALEIPLVREPSDPYVRDRAIEALRDLGFRVVLEPETKVISIER